MNTSITSMLRNIQVKTGWSGPRIAAKLGVSQPTVSRILNGQADCKGSTYDAISRLADSIREGTTLISDASHSQDAA